MKMKIQQLEFDLESEKIRSRHFEGLSQIALFELQKGNWVNAIDRRNRVANLVSDFTSQMKKFGFVKTELVNCINTLENLVCSMNAILQ